MQKKFGGCFKTTYICSIQNEKQTIMATFTASTEQKLKKLIAKECNFTGKSVTSINGIDLTNRVGMPELKVSNRHVVLEKYTSCLGHKHEFLKAPFTVEIA